MSTKGGGVLTTKALVDFIKYTNKVSLIPLTTNFVYEIWLLWAHLEENCKWMNRNEIYWNFTFVCGWEKQQPTANSQTANTLQMKTLFRCVVESANWERAGGVWLWWLRKTISYSVSWKFVGNVIVRCIEHVPFYSESHSKIHIFHRLLVSCPGKVRRSTFPVMTIISG